MGDAFEWSDAIQVIEKAFQNSPVEITVCCYTNSEEPNYKREKRESKRRVRKGEVKPKVSVIGDSHTRGLGSLLEKRSRNGPMDYFSWTQPGATTESMVENLDWVSAHMEPKDNLVVMSGTNDIKFPQGGGASIRMFREARRKIIAQAGRTKVTLVSVPHRYDKEGVNNLIDIYNQQIFELLREEAGKMKVVDNIRYLDINLLLQRDHYAEDGIHLNHTGKRALVEELENTIWDFNKDEELDF